MIQQLRKINLLATATMVVTFSASVALVSLITPRKTSSLKSDKTVTLTSQDLLPLELIDRHSGLFRVQPDSPVQFDGFSQSLVFSRWSVYPQITNRSNRTIRVVVMGYRSKGTRRVDRQASIYDFSYSSSAFEPGKSKTRRAPDSSNEFWIDFVEFSDARTWGPNEMKSRQTLDALRVGFKEATLRFTKILQEDGPDAVTAAIEKEITIPQSQIHDRKWKRDFRSAFSRVSGELRYARELVFNQWGYNYDEFEPALRAKFSAILSKYADSANTGLSTQDYP